MVGEEKISGASSSQLVVESQSVADTSSVCSWEDSPIQSPDRVRGVVRTDAVVVDFAV
jgi:hypothetical protein